MVRDKAAASNVDCQMLQAVASFRTSAVGGLEDQVDLTLRRSRMLDQKQCAPR